MLKTNKKTGIAKDCNDIDCEVGVYKNNQKDGVWKRYDKSDNLIQISNYSEGKLNGATVSFYSNGRVIQQGIMLIMNHTAILLYILKTGT